MTKTCGSRFTRTDTCSYLLLFPVLLVEPFTTLAGALLSPHMVRTGSTSAALRYFPDCEGDRSKNAKWKLTTVKSRVWNALFSLMLTVSDLTAISGSFPPSLIPSVISMFERASDSVGRVSASFCCSSNRSIDFTVSLYQYLILVVSNTNTLFTSHS